MKASPVNFEENNTVGGNYKGSLFKGLFKDRKNLLEGYPAVKKGLAFPEPCLKFGSSTYTFKTTEVVDKVQCKHDGKEFIARYKKDTGVWDISMKAPMCPGFSGLVKYEERGAAPCYVLGLDMRKGDLTANMKVNPASGQFKKSWMYDCAAMAAGVKLAGDVKFNLYDMGNMAAMKWNMGGAYASGAGLTAVAFNEKKIVTVNHSLSINKSTSAILELCASVGDAKPATPMSVAVAHQYDKEHQIRVRGNQKGQVQVCVKKDFSPSLSLLFATTVDASNPASCMKVPAFGFKVCTKC
jgi:hypothetical protein